VDEFLGYVSLLKGPTVSHTLASSSNMYPRLLCMLESEADTLGENLARGTGMGVLHRCPRHLNDPFQLVFYG